MHPLDEMSWKAWCAPRGALGSTTTRQHGKRGWLTSAVIFAGLDATQNAIVSAISDDCQKEVQPERRGRGRR